MLWYDSEGLKKMKRTIDKQYKYYWHLTCWLLFIKLLYCFNIGSLIITDFFNVDVPKYKISPQNNIKFLFNTGFLVISL